MDKEVGNIIGKAWRLLDKLDVKQESNRKIKERAMQLLIDAINAKEQAEVKKKEEELEYLLKFDYEITPALNGYIFKDKEDFASSVYQDSEEDRNGRASLKDGLMNEIVEKIVEWYLEDYHGTCYIKVEVLDKSYK